MVIANGSKELENVAFEFLSKASSSRTIDELDEHFIRLAKAFGFKTAMFINLSRYGRPVEPRLIFGEQTPEWMGRYVEQNYAQLDPTLPLAFTSRDAFTWERAERPDAPRRVRTFFGEARELWAKDSFIVPVHGPFGEFSVVNLLSEQKLQLTCEERTMLQGLCSLYASIGLSLTDTALPPIPERARSLTRRELQCVYWMSMGKHDPDIARLLGISRVTVQEYLDSARAKLEAETRPELSLKALTLGLLIPDRAMMR